MRASNITRRAGFALTIGAAVCAGPISAGAFEATQAEADRIRSAIEDYIGHPAPGGPRLVDLTPKGDTYDLVVDVSPLLAPINAGNDLKIDIGRIITRLAPLPDGTWRQSLDAFPPIAVTIGKDRSEVHYEGLTSEGVFDPAKLYFTRTTMRAAKLSATSTHQPDDKGPGATADVVQEGLDLVATTTPAASGTGVDVVLAQKLAKFTETVQTTGGAETGVPDMTMTVAATDHTVDMRVAGLRYAEILDFWKWIVAHGGADAAKADSVAFKQRLAALGPVLDTFDGTSAIRDLGIETPFGIGGAKALTFAFDGAGLGKDGRFGFRLGIDELKLHTMLAPGWAIRLLPTDIDLRGHFSGWNLADAITAWLDIVDFAHPRPLTDAENTRLAALALPKGVTSIDLTGNHIKGALWDVTIDGKLDAGTAGAKGDITIRATGLDAVAAALGEPRDANAGQALAALTMATTLATRDGAAHVWRFAFDGDAVTLNGQPFGEAKPKAEPAPELKSDPTPQLKSDEPAENKKKKGKSNEIPHPKKLLQQNL